MAKQQNCKKDLRRDLVVSRQHFCERLGCHLASVFDSSTPKIIHTCVEDYGSISQICGTAFIAAAAANRCPNVISHYGFICSGGRAYHSSAECGRMPSLPHGTAFSVISTSASTTVEDIVMSSNAHNIETWGSLVIDSGNIRSLMLQFANGLKHIHKSGYLHCDVSLKNMLLLIFPKNVIGAIRLTSKSVAFVNGLNPKSDVWPLGICFLTMIARQRLEYDNFTFGSVDIESDRTGPARRRIFITKVLTEAVKMGHINSHFKHLFIDLLFGMLAPNPLSRLSLDEVLCNPLFVDPIVVNECDASVRHYIQAGGTPDMTLGSGGVCRRWQYAPAGGTFSARKDQLAVTVFNRALSSGSFDHLNIEAAFVAFDNMMRIIGALSASDERDAKFAITAASAAVIISMMIYEAPCSKPLLGVSSGAIDEMSPVVIEYLCEDLRRNYYMFSHLGGRCEIEYIFNLMIGECGSEFRRAYLELDVGEFISQCFGIGGRVPLHANVKSLCPVFAKTDNEEITIGSCRK